MSQTIKSDPHLDLHSEQGALRGEHPGRSANPVIKVTDLAWLEFEKPDLSKAVSFARAFGLAVHARTDDAVYLRGTWQNTPCIVVRRGSTSRFLGPAFSAGDAADLQRFADKTGRRVSATDDRIGGQSVTVRDPGGHHTLAMTLGPDPGYVHSAYQVNDLDALAAGGEYLLESGYKRAWGVGRHILGSQVFDYWRDPDRLMMEHFTDGDVFGNTVETGWTPMSAANLSQWGPPVTRDFLDINPSPRLAISAIQSLRADNELGFPLLLALMKAMNP
ncbi:MAG: hypothetical protein WCP28_05710 [Actinomycetes bacterium]